MKEKIQGEKHLDILCGKLHDEDDHHEDDHYEDDHV